MTARPISIRGIHHVAIICSDYARSRTFYTQMLGLSVIAETHRPERGSFKLDLAVPGGGRIELFSFSNPPKRPTHPEACGLRHLALAVSDLDAAVASLTSHGVAMEPVRVDDTASGRGSRFTFLADPDGLPIELYEVADATPRSADLTTPASSKP